MIFPTTDNQTMYKEFCFFFVRLNEKLKNNHNILQFP